MAGEYNWMMNGRIHISRKVIDDVSNYFILAERQQVKIELA